MDVKETVKSQYHAALAMLEQGVDQCPEAIWNHPDHTNKTWHIAYHVLFYTHLYLSPTEEDFQPWERHRPEVVSLGPPPDTPYSKDEVLAYLNFCRDLVDPRVDSVDMEAESGFSWLPFNKLECQFYNIRHLQHHTGEISERLGSSTEGVEVQWVGRRKSEK